MADSFAMAIGLDPDPIVQEFVERYPDAVEGELAAAASPRRESPPGPLAIKLTITWSASPLGAFGGVMLARIRKSWRGVVSALMTSG